MHVNQKIEVTFEDGTWAKGKINAIDFFNENVQITVHESNRGIDPKQGPIQLEVPEIEYYEVPYDRVHPFDLKCMITYVPE